MTTTPANASSTYKRQIQEIAWAEPANAHYVETSAEAMALEATLQSAAYMDTKGRVSNAVTGITANLVTGSFPNGVSGVVTDSEVYIDEYIRFDESTDGSNYTRWYKVRQYIDSSNIRLYETLPAPGGTYQGYQVGRLIWQRVVFAPGEYNLDGFRCIPGLVLAAQIPGTAKIVEEQSGAQNPFVDLSENIFTDLDFYPNEAWDSLDGFLGAADSHWAGVRCEINNCTVRHGGMGEDHSAGVLTIPMFTGGTTIIRNSQINSSRQVGGVFNATATADITAPVPESRLIWENNRSYRVGDYQRGANLFGQNMFHAPADATTYLSDSLFIWDEIYETAEPGAGEPALSCILVGDYGSTGYDSENAKVFIRNVLCKMTCAHATPILAAINVNEATSEVVIDNSQFEISSGNSNSASAQFGTGSVQKINNCTIISDQVGVLLANGSVAVLSHCSVDSTDIGVSCVTGASGILNGGSYTATTYALSIVFGTLTLGPNVILNGPEINTFGTINYTHSGEVTLNGTTPVAATLVDAGVLGPSTRISLSRKTAGGTLGHFSVTARTDRTGFSIVGQASDTSVVEWFITT